MTAYKLVRTVVKVQDIGRYRDASTNCLDIQLLKVKILMRIAFLVNQFPALSETFILNQITGLIDRGHEVDIYSDYIGKTTKIHSEVQNYNLLEHTFYGQIPANRFVRVFKALGLIGTKGWKNPVVFLRSLNILKYGQRAKTLQLLYSSSRFVGKQPYDIIHCQLGFLGYEGLLFREVASLKGKLVVSFRGSDFMLYLNMFGQHYFDKLFEQADLLLPVCASMKRQMIELGCNEDKIVVHRSGLELEKFVFNIRRKLPDNPVRIVTVARLVESKGVEYAIRAVANVVNFHPKLEYSIVGDGPLMESLQQLTEELGVNNIVKLVGWKKREEVIEILNLAHLMIVPSVTAKNGAIEGIPNVLKEAMAIGLPVITTEHSGIPELVQDGVSGFLVPERDVDSLAEKLGYLIEHPELWPEMGHAGRTFVEKNYDLEQLNDRLVEIYQECLCSSAKQSAKPENFIQNLS